MRVFICDETVASYSAGLVVVAANSLEEAVEIIINYNGGNDWFCFNEHMVKESPLLTADVDEPQVIHEMSYFEQYTITLSVETNIECEIFVLQIQKSKGLLLIQSIKNI